MKRIIIKLGVFLLLGAVVNVAVAWGFAVWMPYPFPSESDFRVSEPQWRAPVPEDWTATPESTVIDTTVGRTIVESRGPVSGELTFEHQEIWSYGFPMRTLGMQRSVIGNVWFNVPREWDDQWQIPSTLPWQPWPSYVVTQPPKYVPRDLLATGFTINTFSYAMILWLLFAAPGRVRRWRRIRRGLCAKCAYPVGTSDVCTECGALVKTRVRGSMGLPPPATPAGGASTL